MSVVTAVEEGSRLGKYRIRTLLGRGGMGAVYLAEDTLLDREVAVKLLLPALGSDPGFLARFREEARAVSRLSHPNIVHINSLERLDEQFVIDMEYVPGMPLDRRMGRGMHPVQVFAMAYEVLGGLAACHAAGVIHRDIKPSNILLTSEDRVKLTDFGIAKAHASHMEAAVAQHTSSGFFLGTPLYAPPELWEGLAPTPAWDVYSVGVVMYQALTGRLPFEAATPFALMKQVQSQPIVPVSERAPSVSPELAAYVHGLLNANPDKRPSHAAAALEGLRALPEADHASLPELPTVSVPRREAEKPVRRVPRRVWIGLAAVLALAGAALGFWALLGALDRSGAADAPPAAALVSQEEALQTALLSPEELLSRPRFSNGPEYLFFDTLSIGGEPGTRHELHWMMEAPNEDGESAIVAAAGRSLWSMRMQRASSGELIFTGNWSEYLDAAGTVFRRGTIEGHGRWTVEPETLVASLTLADPSYRTQREMTLVASRHDADATDSRFLHGFEQSPHLQPMLFRDLLPRRLEWAGRLETLLPAVAGARFVVPHMEDSAGQVAIDGVLESFAADEPPGSSGDTGVFPGAPTDRGARLWVRSLPDGLYLAFAFPAGGGRPAALRLAWLPELDIPA